MKVDGSMLEGGGQLFRTTLALSYLTHQSFELFNIRAGRGSGGGLGNQHVTCISSLNQLALHNNDVYKVSGADKGSSNLKVEMGAGTERQKINQTYF